MPAASSAARTAVRSPGSLVISKTSSSSADVLRPGVDGDHQVVLAVALGVDDDHALLVEQVGHRARLAEVAAVLVERVADLGAGAVAVVRRGLHQQRHAARAVALVHDRLERVGVAARARALGDGALDVVLGHRRVLGLLDGQRERRVALDVAAALLGRHRDGARELGEELAPAGVDDRLLVLDPRPLGMTGHACSLGGRAVAPRILTAHANERSARHLQGLRHPRPAGRGDRRRRRGADRPGLRARALRARRQARRRAAVGLGRDMRLGAPALAARYRTASWPRACTSWTPGWSRRRCSTSSSPRGASTAG